MSGVPVLDVGRGASSAARLVDAAERAVTAHEEAVARTLRAVEQQRTAIAALRDGVVEASASADAVAAFAAELARIADSLPGDAAASRATLDDLARSLETVSVSLENGRVATDRLDTGWRGVDEAVDGVGRAARRARVLAVNAAIEAAYVSSSEGGFAIVAERMRALSTSTIDATRDVHGIVAATRGSAEGVFAAIAGARKACGAVGAALAAAVRDFEAARGRGDAFADDVARIAAIAAEQQAVAAQIAGSVGRLAQLADQAADQARASAHGIGDGVAAARSAVALGGAREVADAARGLTATAIAAARGAAAWNAADATLDSLRAELTQIAVALEESTRAAHALDASADGIVATLDQIDAVFGAAFDAFDRAAGDVRAAHAHGEAVRSGIVAMHEATGRAGAIVDAVGEISAESGLLAINAAIEAARAGERGLGFTVIADEIGRLANETRDATDGIAETIEALRGRSNELEATSARGADDMDAVVVDAQSGREAIDALRATIGASADRTRSVATTARALAARSTAILAELATARDALADLGREEREAARFALSDLLGDAHRLAENAGVQLTVGRLHQLLTSAAVEIEGVFARALAEGRTTFAALGDTDYVELRGAEVDHLARFVDVRTAPRDGFTPKKWRTSYDAAVDTEAMAVLDRTMASEPLIGSMGLFDPNGFAIAMPSFVSTTTEWSRNRAKWIFADPIMQRMVKVGIGKPVLPRPWSAFAYLQADTGAVFINIATAIFVNGERVAACSLIVEASRASD